MATFQITMKDNVYAAVLQTFDGETDVDKLLALKRFVRQTLREKARVSRELVARETANAAMRDAVAQIDLDLSEE